MIDSFTFATVMLLVFILGVFIIPSFMLKRAINQVIDIFRKNHSLCSDTPMTIEELGLTPPTVFERMFRFRDYKPYALQFLSKIGALREIENRKVCLLENKLTEFPWIKQ